MENKKSKRQKEKENGGRSRKRRLTNKADRHRVTCNRARRLWWVDHWVPAGTDTIEGRKRCKSIPYTPTKKVPHIRNHEPSSYVVEWKRSIDIDVGIDVDVARKNKKWKTIKDNLRPWNRQTLRCRPSYWLCCWKADTSVPCRRKRRHHDNRCRLGTWRRTSADKFPCSTGPEKSVVSSSPTQRSITLSPTRIDVDYYKSLSVSTSVRVDDNNLPEKVSRWSTVSACKVALLAVGRCA